MLPDEILIRTKTARTGMLVREVFEECLKAHLQSLPFCDEEDKVVGRVTLKYIINHSIVPEYMAELAHVLGHEMSAFDNMEARLKQVFDAPVDAYVQEPHVAIETSTPLMKALAIMEHHDTSYLFVVDEGRYGGTVTIPSIAMWMSSLDRGR